MTKVEKSEKAPAKKPPKGSKVVEELFREHGKERTLANDEVFITQGAESESAFYIKSGKVRLLLDGEKGQQLLATRGAGDVLGELSLLLGHEATVTAVAEGPCAVIEVLQTELLSHLRNDPGQSGRLFKAMAVALAERISELSGKLRSQVVSKSASASKQTQQLPAADIAKARGMFGLQSDEKLISLYGCSVRSEKNAIKEEHAHVGEVYIFTKHLCFDLKVFAFHKQMVIESKDIVALLKSNTSNKTIDVQLKGASYEVTIDNGYEEAVMLIEAARLQAKSAEIAKDTLNEIDPNESAALEQFNEMLEPIVLEEGGNKRKHNAVDFDLTEEDWRNFLAGAKQRTYKKGEYVLKEGQPTAALFQIVKGTARVELQIKDQAQAIIVGYRHAGEMFGETSLLKSGVATASIAADEETTIVCLEGSYLEELFQSSPGLPGRFFCFIAAYEAERLYQLTQSAAEAKKPTVTAANSVRLPLADVMSNQAFNGIFKKFLVAEQHEENAKNPNRTSAKGDGKDHTTKPSVAIAAFEFVVAEDTLRQQPEAAPILQLSGKMLDDFLVKPDAPEYLPFLPDDLRKEAQERRGQFEKGQLTNQQARKMFTEIADQARAYLETHWFEAFMGSDHYPYILELKAKEAIVPKLEQFQVIRVLGEGGFGQVIEVVKRDCGVRYAMKVMQKEAMKQALGITWRKKIAMEANILSALQHPFMVNLKYAFQNPEFLCLVMDLVPSGDLSEFVLTPRRLTPEQARWGIMETVEVISYMHAQKILYRDLKPENLLVDDEGHVRLIDMGLAVRWSGDKPRRTSRVGTDCYMAPEVRWARKNREAYGMSVDWYTVGVLLYEFSNGALPYSQRDQPKPVYRPGTFPSHSCQEFCEKLLEQDWRSRLGCTARGVEEIKSHAYFTEPLMINGEVKGTPVDWDIVAACSIPSPLKGVKGVPKRKKDKEQQAQRTAHNMLEADLKDGQQSAEDQVHTWDYVSPVAVSEEYLESMYRCVSSI